MPFLTSITGPRGYSNCKKIKADIKTKKVKVAPGDTVRIAVWLVNKSDGDIDDGHWFIILPPGVTYVGSSIRLAQDGQTLSLNPVQIFYQGEAAIHEPNAPNRLTFHSFLDDDEGYCEATDALTVGLVF